MKKKCRLTSFLYFIPSLFVMILIYRFSAQDATDSSGSSMQFAATFFTLINRFLKIGLDADSIQTSSASAQFFIRKMAHVSEYFILSIVTLNALLQFFRKSGTVLNPSNSHLFFCSCISFLICFFYACSDEIHQKFVPGRYCCFRDVLIDSTGILFGILIVNVISLLNKRRKKKRKTSLC